MELILFNFLIREPVITGPGGTPIHHVPGECESRFLRQIVVTLVEKPPTHDKHVALLHFNGDAVFLFEVHWPVNIVGGLSVDNPESVVQLA
jgi:hypothetical protein